MSTAGCDYIGNIRKLITLCLADDYGFILISTLKIYLRRLNMRSTHKKVIIKHLSHNQSNWGITVIYLTILC